MLRPHGGPQNHLLRNATIIVMFRMCLNRFFYRFESIAFGVTLRFCQLRSTNTGTSSHFLIYPYDWTPWGSPKEFVTECHHNSSIQYVPGNVLVGKGTKGFWCNTLSLAAFSIHNRKSSHFLAHPYAQTPRGSSKPFVTKCHHISYVPYVS